MKDWYVLYTKPRNEKKAALDLEKIGVTVYCPLVTEIHQWSDRKKKVEVPLIKSYIFVQLEEKNREIVFQAPGIVRYVLWLKKPAIVRESEIKLLQESLKETISEVEVMQMKPGDLMDISSGPFKGKKGIVNEVNGKSVQFILQGLGVKIRLTKA